MFVENIIWLVIGFAPTYGAMELAWRISKRMLKNRIEATIAPEMVSTSSTLPAANSGK